MISYGRHNIDEEDIATVVEVLRGDWLTQGPKIEMFERAVSEYARAEHAVAFSSGTAALHGAAWAAGLGSEDIVHTTPLTFIATVNAARYVGATAELIDIDINTWNLNLSLLPEYSDAVLPVHYAGLPLDLAPERWIKKPKVVIEDASHALGSKTPEGPVGNCAHSEMVCFSFHPVKPITTGEGGMVTTNNHELAERLRRFRSHGIVRKPQHGEWYYEVEELGYNYRMTDIQAALGLSQMKKLERYIERRNELATQYRELLRGLPLQLPPSASKGFLHGYHLFAVLVPDRMRVFSELRSKGIGVQVHYVPVHHHPTFKSIKQIPSGLSVSEHVYSQVLSLPMHPGLTKADLSQVVEALEQALSSTGDSSRGFGG